jgi:hypothetical protein
VAQPLMDTGYPTPLRVSGPALRQIQTGGRPA